MSAEPAHPTLEGLPLPQERFLNREESWLQFNQRVLEMAEDPSLPLLERVRFLAIFASNLDEFFRVRVAGLKRRMATGLLLRTKSGLKPREELARIAAIADDLAQRHSTCFQERVLPQLAAEDIEIVRWDDLGREERSELRKLFRERDQAGADPAGRRSCPPVSVYFWTCRSTLPLPSAIPPAVTPCSPG